LKIIYNWKVLSKSTAKSAGSKRRRAKRALAMFAAMVGIKAPKLRMATSVLVVRLVSV
jgi:hypothetical protein